MDESPPEQFRLVFPGHSEIPALLALQEAFVPPPSAETPSVAYAIRHDPFSMDDFSRICAEQECLLLLQGERPLGYMLLDNYSATNGLREYRQVMKQLVEEEEIPEEDGAFIRYAEALHPALYGEEFKEIRWQMLSNLLFRNKGKYKGAAVSVLGQSDKLLEKINLGWQVAFDNGIYYFLLWDFCSMESWDQSKE